MFWSIARVLLPIWSHRWLERRRVVAGRRAARSASVATPPHRLLVDLTMIARRDVRTGIQRVVRSTVSQMRLHPHSWDIQTVRYVDGAFRHTVWPAADVAEGTVLNPRPGDVFLGLDLSFDAIRRNAHQLLRYKRSGTRFWFVVYDLLPLRSPQHFSAKVVVRFRLWLIATAKLADGYICISPHIANDLRAVLAQDIELGDEVDVQVIPMGFDILPTGKAAEPTTLVAPPVTTQNLVLAVGTLEPRKGYTLLLDAFDLLWKSGAEATLVIVGAGGWKTRALQRRILAHAEFGQRLHWLSTVDDAGLDALYDRAHALIAASFEEGFGLPVLEAIAHSCPVLARDIPAFRAHAQYGLRYFPADADAVELAEAIGRLLRDSCDTPGPALEAQLPRWRDTSDSLLSLLAREVRYRQA